MASFRDSQTAHNLLLSYSAEAQARTRYNFFATRAKEEGLIQIARLFGETAEQEYEHALRFFKFFNGGKLEIKGVFPSGAIHETHANLLSSAELERFVHDEMYAVFAEKAEEEGYARAADTFNAINVSEKQHELMFLELADKLQSGNAFQKETETIWKCLGCGYLHQGFEPPKKCPACVKPSGYFALHVKTW